LKQYIKNFIKDKLYIFKVGGKFSSEVQISQRHLFHYYRDCAASGIVPSLNETGYSVFSQFEEDGLLLFIFAVIGAKSQTFVEIGGNDGINSNCSNLVMNFGWHGLFIDADKTSVKRGINFYRRYPTPWHYPPQFICSKVTRENINHLISNAGFNGEIDLLSVDIDGNDYWIWDALEIIQPRVVIIETHVEFGMKNIVVPYDQDYSFPGKHPVYHGASPVAMSRLAERKGYRLAGANRRGFNHIYIKNGLADDLIPAVDPETTLNHPSTIESFRLFDEIKDWEYISG
jgi:hypothetical protein